MEATAQQVEDAINTVIDYIIDCNEHGGVSDIGINSARLLDDLNSLRNALNAE